MKKIRNILIDGNFVVGSSITITVLLGYDTSGNDAITITIEDPTDTVKVDWASMTKLSDSVFQYIYQNATTNEDGIYWVTIKATSGSNTIYEQKYFELSDQELLT